MGTGCPESQVTGFNVAVQSMRGEYDPFVAPVGRAVEATLLAEGAPPGVEVAVVLTSDEDMAEYHVRFMGVAGPTDVLSWPSGEDLNQPEPFLGDVMVSCDSAAAQARSLRHSVEREVCVLAVHGALHLLGWDDQTAQAQVAMQQRVDGIVDRPGLA